jgi:prephenate dehydrogenase
VTTLLVVGTGLIGSSFALAARRSGCFDRILGVDSAADALATAQSLDIIDAGLTDLASAVAQADAVFVAVPPGVTATVLAEVFACMSAHSQVVFDGASVKCAVIDDLRERLAGLPKNYVPAHPMAGSERHGPAAASAELFAGCQVFLTPEPETAAEAVRRVAGYWRKIGAYVHEGDARRHDEMVAVTSHLPHLLAYAYMNLIAERVGGAPRGIPAEAPLDRYAGSGFRDFARIAGSEAELWRQIIEANRDQVSVQLGALDAVLVRWRVLLDQGRFDELQAAFEDARRVYLGIVAPGRSGAAARGGGTGA